MSSAIATAIKQICTEKNIPYEAVIDAIEHALAAAYRKDFSLKNQNIQVEFDPETGQSKVFDVKTVIEDELAQEKDESLEREETPDGEMKQEEFLPLSTISSAQVASDVVAERDQLAFHFHPRLHIALTEAQKIQPDARIGSEIKMPLDVPGEFGRMAAQTAKQVITQRLREAERNTIYNDFLSKEHTVMTVVVQRVERNYDVLIDFGKVLGILPRQEQTSRDRYNTGMRLKVFILSVRLTSKGPEILVSRTHPELVRDIFETEIPEVANGSIEIKGIARDPGFRSKVAVFTEREHLDPIGSCVGQRGNRVQTMITELNGEKLDIIQYSDKPEDFIAHALLPAKVLEVNTDDSTKVAKVVVAGDQLSLAIGRGGQNVRLASNLTGWNIQILEQKDGEQRVLSEDELQGIISHSSGANGLVSESTQKPILSEENIQASASGAEASTHVPESLPHE